MDECPGPSAGPSSSKRNPNFTVDETKCLLQIWGSPEIQEKFGKDKRHSFIWEETARQLFENGNSNFPKRVGLQVKNRVNTLKTIYTKFKARVKSGAEAPSTEDFPFWDEFELTLGTRPSISGEFATDSMAEPAGEPVIAHENQSLDNEGDQMAEDSGPSMMEGRLSTRVLKKRKTEQATDDIHKGILEVQKKNLEINQQRFQTEKEMIQSMTEFFRSGAEYFDAKKNSYNRSV